MARRAAGRLLTPTLDPAYDRADVKRRYLVALQLLLIVLATAAAYLPTLENGFTNWDDPELLVNNDLVRGLTADHVRAMFSRSLAGFGGYTPLVFISYAVEYELFGLDPKVVHADNLALHVLNTILVYALIFLIGRNIWTSFAVSLLFGLHPLHVEAVAWAQGRKDLLFSFFFLAAAICYLLVMKRKNGRNAFYALALFCFALSLLSKVAALSFPLVILLFEYFGGGRIDRTSWKRAAPFFLLGLAFLVLAFLTLGPAGQGMPMPKIRTTYFQNLALFFYAFVFYISKTLVPVRLIARYSADIFAAPSALVLNLAVFAVGAALIAAVYRRRKEAVTFGIAFFILTLLPTLPFHFLGQPYADRYTYLPLIGILFILSVGGVELLASRLKKPILVGVGAAGALALTVYWGAVTRSLGRYWHDSVTLWTRVLEIDPVNSVALFNRGYALSDLNELDKAWADFEAVEKIVPRDPNIYNERGVIHFKREEWDAALTEFGKSIAVDPRFPLGYLNRGILWGRRGEYGKAVADLSAAIAINSRLYQAYFYRALAFKALNRPDLALADFRAAYEIRPNEQIQLEIERLASSKGP